MSLSGKINKQAAEAVIEACKALSLKHRVVFQIGPGHETVSTPSDTVRYLEKACQVVTIARRTETAFQGVYGTMVLSAVKDRG